MKTIVYFALGGLAVAGTAYLLIKQNKKPILSTLDESNKISTPTSASSLTKPSTSSGTVGVNPKIEEPLKVFQTGYVAPKTTADNTVPVKYLEQVVKETGAEGLAKALDEANRDRQAQILLDTLLNSNEAKAVTLPNAWTQKTFSTVLQKYNAKRTTTNNQLTQIGYKLVGGEYKKTGAYGSLTLASAIRV